MKLPRGMLFLPLLACLAQAQRSVPPARSAPERPPATLPQLPPQAGNWRIPHDRIYVSAQPDGSPQVRGGTYKAEFTPESASYIPFLGSAARANHPVGFRIDSIRSGGALVPFATGVVASESRGSVRYDRGSVTEIYELALESVEQKFVFETLPSTGDLVLRLAAEGAGGPAWDGNRIVFATDEGGVRYGAATAVDAHGNSAPVATEIVDGNIEIRVPAAFVAAAVLPLTVDPVITTFWVPGILGDSMNDLSPSISWDETYQRYCVVYEEEFSGNDHDAVYVWLSGTGAFVSAGYVDGSLIAYWATPDVANNNNSNEFYIVAAVGDPSFAARTVHGRTLDAGSGILGIDTNVSVGDSGDKYEPSVGGDPYGSIAAYFTTVWTRSTGNEFDIHMRQTDQSGTLLGGSYTPLADSWTWDFWPRISKSCQQAGTHHVVWQSRPNAYVWDIVGAEVSWAGAITIPATTLSNSAGDNTRPACSSIDAAGRWIVVHELDVPFYPDDDIVGLLMSNLTILDIQNLTLNEAHHGTSTEQNDQRQPNVELEGTRFVCAYAEEHTYGSANYDVWVTTLDIVNSQLYIGESHIALGTTATQENQPRLASRQGSGGSGNEVGIVWWHDTTSQLGNTEGALYTTGEFTKLCTPTFYGVMSCPCSNGTFSLGKGCDNSSGTGGASLDASGSPSIAADSVVFTSTGEKPTATSVLMQGPTLVGAGVVFGQGVRCVGGSLKRLYTKTASFGSISAPVSGDPSVHARSAALGDTLIGGSTRYYFVYYRDPTVLGGCPGSSTFNCSDVVQAVWRP